MTSKSVPPLWSIPKSQRPNHGSYIQLMIFAIIFNGGIILVNLTQILSYPLSLFAFTKALHLRITFFTKASFGTLSVLLSERFAPTKFIITAGEGMPIESEWLERNTEGEVIGINLPNQGVWVRKCLLFFVVYFFFLILFLLSLSTLIFTT